jgi:general secretion pathway protein N
MKRLFLLGIVSTLVFLCIYAPAQLLGSLLGQMTHGRLGLAATQGSLWQGNGNLLLNSLDNNTDGNNDALANNTVINLGKIAWNTQALQLLAGRFSVNLTWNDGAPFWLMLDTTRLHIEHAAFALPADIVSALVPALKAAQLGGQLSVRCENFSLTRTEILGQLDIDWNQASSPLSMVNPLGNYRTKLNGIGNALEIKLETQGDSPLILQGNGRWLASEGLHFDGTAEANAANKTQLQGLLRVMGNEASNETSAASGRYQLKF